ncbi:MAG: hypothetical protein ACT4QG_05660 [Sporichthyaceae bacterium]
MPNFARIATRATAVAAALAAGIAVAPAASAQSGKESLDLSGLFTDTVVTGSLVLDGNVGKLVNLSSVTQVVDELGRSIGSPRTVALRSGTGNGKLAKYSCLPKTKGNKHFTAFTPAEAFLADDKGKTQALFYAYRQERAREMKTTNGERYDSTQFEICGVGGSDTEGGSRLRRAGVGIAYADAGTTYKIGQNWKEGETPANYTMDLAFSVPIKAVEIAGGISQTPTNKLTGSIGTPFKTDVDVYARNAVNAWWEDSCTGSWMGCRKWSGSKDFHGAVAHSLFEFTPQKAKTVEVGGFQLHAFRSAS